MKPKTYSYPYFKRQNNLTDLRRRHRQSSFRAVNGHYSRLQKRCCIAGPQSGMLRVCLAERLLPDSVITDERKRCVSY